jgi:hypothetical protein
LLAARCDLERRLGEPGKGGDVRVAAVPFRVEARCFMLNAEGTRHHRGRCDAEHMEKWLVTSLPVWPSTAAMVVCGLDGPRANG